MPSMPVAVDPSTLPMADTIGLMCDLPAGMGNIQVTGELYGSDTAMVTLRLRQYQDGVMVQETNHDEDMTGLGGPQPININVAKMNGNVDKVVLYGVNAQGGASLQKVKIDFS